MLDTMPYAGLVKYMLSPWFSLAGSAKTIRKGLIVVGQQSIDRGNKFQSVGPRPVLPLNLFARLGKIGGVAERAGSIGLGEG